MNKKTSSPVSLAMVVYNEATHISAVLEEYARDVYSRLPQGSEFLVYLDAPTDATPSIVRHLQERYTFTILEGKRNLGYAGAMKRLLAEAHNEIIFYSDSSGKHKAADFWKLLPYIQSADIVTGDRQQRSDPLIRRVLTQIQRGIVVFLFGVPFYDYNTGFKIVRKKVVRAVLAQCRYTKQSFSTEFCIRAIRKGFTVANVPVSFTGRAEKRSGTNMRHLPEIIIINTRGMVALWRELSRS